MFRRDRPYSKMRQMILWGGLFLFTILLQIFARRIPGFAEWYAVTLYPVLFRVLGGISNLVCVAVDEIALYLIAVGICGYVAFGICKVWKRDLTLASWAGKTAGCFARIGILWFLVFTVNCGINYHRTPFSELAGLPMEESTVGELEELCLYLTEQMEEMAGEIILQENGLCALPEDMREKTRCAMIRLGETYPQLSGWYPKAKPVLASRLLSLGFLEGVSGPYTMEANYNKDIPAYNQPAVICHELSHLKGFMREDEANYIAWLACRDSEDANIRYSGLMMAYTYSINALYKADHDRFLQVRGLLCSQAELDLAYHRYYWDQYKGTVSEVSDRVNDAYLKANAQTDGTESYGRMVDLLLGEYRQRER